MTVPVQVPVSSSIANGVTTVFPYTFKIVDAKDLTITVDDVVITTGFTISGVGNDSGGDVTFSSPPSNGAKVIRFLNPVLERLTDYQQFGDWVAMVVNGDFDRIWLTLQYLSQAIVRTIQLPVDTLTVQQITADALTRADKILGFDADGNITIKTASEVSADIQAAIEEAIDAANAAEAARDAALISANNAAASAIDAANSAAAAAATPVAGPIHAATAKATPVDADEFGYLNSAASFSLVKFTWANIKAALKTYFDTLYNTVTVITAAADSTFANSSVNAAATNWVKGMSFGWGQTLQNLTGSRAVNTTYTNSTSKPILVSVYTSQTSGTTSVILIVGGLNVSQFHSIVGATVSCLVPPGATYRVDVVNMALGLWAEFR